jgi:hypothetical protein
VPDFADPVTERLNQALNKVGPHGYTHGWVFHGVPGTSAHAAAVRSLANSVAGKSPDAEAALNRAADSIDSKDYKAATDHIADAHTNLMADHGNPEDVAAIDHSARGLSSLRGTSTDRLGHTGPSDYGTPNSPAYQHGTSLPLEKPRSGMAFHGSSPRQDSSVFASQPSEQELAGRWQTTPSGEAYVVMPNGQRVNVYGQTVANTGPNSLSTFASNFGRTTQIMRETGEPGEQASREVQNHYGAAVRKVYLHITER